MTAGRLPRTAVGWFAFGLVEFLVVVGLVLALPESLPVQFQVAIALGSFAGLGVLNLWLVRLSRGSGPR